MMTKLEHLVFQLSPCTVTYRGASQGSSSQGSAILRLHDRHRQIPLTSLQVQYLGRLKQGQTIQQLVLGFLKEGWLIRFGELYELIHHLTQEKAILNPGWQETFYPVKPQVSQTLTGTKENPSEAFKKLPFFNGLDPQLLLLFGQNSQIYEAQPRVQVCTQGQKTRDLFGLLSGEAGVYFNHDHQRQLVIQLKAPTVFGEGGFLLNQPRQADVVTLTPCRLLRLRFQEQFQDMINTSKAATLRHRFWVLHALSLSEIFKSLPVEVHNEIAQLARLHELKPPTYLFQENDRGTSFYILIQGRLNVLQNGRILKQLEPGSCFGEISLLLTQGQRTASVQVQAPSLVAEIPQQPFYHLLAENLELARQLESQALRSLHQDQKRQTLTRP